MATSTAAPVGAKSRGVFIKTAFKDLRNNSALFLPQSVAVIGPGSTSENGSYPLTKSQFFSAGEVGELYGFGCPLHIAAQKLLPVNGDGLGTVPMIVYPLNDEGGGSAPAVGTITPVNAATETQSYTVVCGGVVSQPFVVAPGDVLATMLTAMVTAVNANTSMPVIATDTGTEVTLTAKHHGTSGNFLSLTVDGPSVGVTFTVVALAGGLINPDVQPALDQFGEDWETLIVNCLDAADTTAMDAFSTFNEGRWSSSVRKPIVAALVAAAISVTDVRKLDRTNAQIPVEAGIDAPWAIAAEAAMRIAVLSNNNPPHDYAKQKLFGLTPGAPGSNFDYTERNAVVEGGSVYTMYHPDNQPIPAYAKVVNNVKVANILYNLNVIFESDPWAGAPLIPDGQATNNPTAKQPGDAVSAISTLIDNLALAAIISDPETAKASILANISSVDGNRLDVSFTVQLSGNTDVISVDFNFGFFFGSAALVA
jgi:phage tail sheath gpL-like